MATTDTTKVLTVDTGGAITNLKEFKKHLDDLKGTLLGLEEGTEEYKKVAEELRSGQQKLNDVMYESKKNSEGLEGSYDALVVKMRELKKEWRATADEGKRNDLGKQILDINNQLKNLDASTGNFQRNVGDYKNAFSAAFEKMLGPLGKMGGTLGNIARDVKGMIPLINTVNSTAVKGLQGIKAAIASTGIGLLIVALGELIANWDSVRDAIFGADTEVQKFISDNEKLLKQQEREEENIGYKVKILEAEGKSRKDIIKYQKTEYENLMGLVQAQQLETQAKINNIRAQGWFIRWITGGNSQIEQLEESLKSLEQREQSLAKSIRGFTNDLKVETIKGSKGVSKTVDLTADEILKRLKDFGKSELQILTENYNAQRKRLQAELENELIDWKKYEEALNKLVKEYEVGRTNILKEFVQKGVDVVDVLNQAFDPNYDANKVLSEYEESTKILEKAYKAEVALYGTTEAEKDAIHQKYVNAFKLLEQKRDDDLKNLRAEELADLKKDSDTRIKTINDSYKGTTEKYLSYADKEYTATVSIGQAFKNLFNPESINTWYAAAQQNINSWRKLIEDTHNSTIAKIDEELSTLETDSDRYKELTDMKIAEDQRYLDSQKQIAEEELKVDEEQNKKKSELFSARMQIIQTGLQTTASLLTNLANLQEQQLRDDVQNRNISEKEAKKKFKTIKNMQYAAAVMETAQAAMGAYSALASIPYVGPALGIAAAAAAVAQGMMQIKTIKKTKFDGGSSGGDDIKTPDMSAISNEYTPQYAQNMQTNSELSELSNAVGNINPVVQVVDIESGLNTSKVRVEETTF